MKMNAWIVPMRKTSKSFQTTSRMTQSGDSAVWNHRTTPQMLEPERQQVHHHQAAEDVAEQPERKAERLGDLLDDVERREGDPSRQCGSSNGLVKRRR